MSKNATPKTIYLKDYTPPLFWIDNVNLRFELGEEETRVLSEMDIRRNEAVEGANILELHGEDLRLGAVFLNERALSDSEFSVGPDSLWIAQVPDQFTLQIETFIKPQENTSLEGLYKSSGNYCTQCEAQGFRKITYYQDRPDVMARFTTTIVAKKQNYPVLLSNGNPVDSGDLESGMHFVTWEDPFKKPCYLFALVAGYLKSVDDTFKTMSGREVALQIFVEEHNLDKCEHAMRSLKNAMLWDEQKFGREYDLDIYMIVAVDDFNMGAMENKGLNVFNSKYVLAKQDTATDVHESHMRTDVWKRLRACTVGRARSLRIASSRTSFHWRATECVSPANAGPANVTAASVAAAMCFVRRISLSCLSLSGRKAGRPKPPRELNSVSALRMLRNRVPNR